MSEEYLGDKVKKLKEKLKEAEGKAREYLDGWQRERAEMANARKRDEEAKRDFLKFAKADMIEQLMPVLDSFELSLAHPSTSSGQAAHGLEAIYRQLIQVLKANGLEEMSPLGEDFDPRRHEAIGTVETVEGEDGKVVEVAQKGYILSGKIVRPAKVKVGEYKN